MAGLPLREGACGHKNKVTEPMGYAEKKFFERGTGGRCRAHGTCPLVHHDHDRMRDESCRVAGHQVTFSLFANVCLNVKHHKQSQKLSQNKLYNNVPRAQVKAGRDVESLSCKLIAYHLIMIAASPCKVFLFIVVVCLVVEIFYGNKAKLQPGPANYHSLACVPHPGDSPGGRGQGGAPRPCVGVPVLPGTRTDSAAIHLFS